MASTVRTVISPGRYVQGKGAIHQLGEYLKQIGSKPLIVADDLVWGFVGHDVEASLTKAGSAGAPGEVQRHPQREGGRSAGRGHQGDRLRRRASRSVAAAPSTRSRPPASWPASAGRTARRWPPPTRPCSALSVIYTETGEFSEYRFFPRNPDLVLVDSQIVANAPVALLIAGVGDALATWLEARATSRSNSKTMAGGLPTLTGTALAQLSWEVLWENALAGDRRRPRSPGDARRGEGHRGQHAAVGARLRVRRPGRGARHPQRADRGAADPWAGARAEGEHRIGDAAGPGGRPDVRHPRLHRVHHQGRAADHAHRGRPAAPTISNR